MDIDVRHIVDACREYFKASTYRQNQEPSSYVDRAIAHAETHDKLPLLEIIALERVSDALNEIARGGQILDYSQLNALVTAPDFIRTLPSLLGLDTNSSHPMADGLQHLTRISDDLVHISSQSPEMVQDAFKAVATSRHEPDRKTRFAEQVEAYRHDRSHRSQRAN